MFLLSRANLCNAQVVDIKELTLLFDVPIQILEKKININKWNKINELKNDDNIVYLSNYRYKSPNGDIQPTKIRMVEYLKGPPKIILFMTANMKTIIELETKILATKFNLVETNNKNGALNKTYINGKYLYIYSKAETTSVLLITTSKEYLQDKKTNSHNPS